jgi:hypothetical protein
MMEAWPFFTVTSEPDRGPSSMIEPALGEFGGDGTAFLRLDGAHLDVDALTRPDTMPSGPSATACTALASVTMENTTVKM